MSVYVGIDVHRKRSQVAVVTEDGQVQLNKNVVNGSEPFLRLIGDLPSVTAGSGARLDAMLTMPPQPALDPGRHADRRADAQQLAGGLGDRGARAATMRTSPRNDRTPRWF